MTHPKKQLYFKNYYLRLQHIVPGSSWCVTSHINVLHFFSVCVCQLLYILLFVLSKSTILSLGVAASCQGDCKVKLSQILAGGPKLIYY